MAGSIRHQRCCWLKKSQVFLPISMPLPHGHVDRRGLFQLCPQKLAMFNSRSDVLSKTRIPQSSSIRNKRILSSDRPTDCRQARKQVFYRYFLSS